MPKFIKLPMDCPDTKDHIVHGINAKGKDVYLCKYTKPPKNTVEVFAWLECTQALAHRFKSPRVAALAAAECDMPAYNQPAEEVMNVIDIPSVRKADWDNIVSKIVGEFFDYIEVEEK